MSEVLNKPTILDYNDCLDIAYMRDDGSTWGAIASYMNVSEKTCRRAYKWYNWQRSNIVTDNKEEEQECYYNEPVSVKYNVIMTRSSITINNDDTGETQIVTDESKVFSEIFDKLVASQLKDNSVIAECFVLADVKESIEKFSDGNLVIDIDSDSVLYKGNIQIPSEVSQRIVDMVRSGDDGYKTLTNFMNKLMENPSNRAVNELYSFLVASDIEIDKDGYVICFKKVGPNYMDIYTNTFDNRPGNTLEVMRNQVNEDSSVTCSYGLHVCSKSYLNYYGLCKGNRVVKVKVDPANFCAVPSDYNNAKARVCKYEVLEDVTHLV